MAVLCAFRVRVLFRGLLVRIARARKVARRCFCAFLMRTRRERYVDWIEPQEEIGRSENYLISRYLDFCARLDMHY